MIISHEGFIQTKKTKGISMYFNPESKEIIILNNDDAGGFQASLRIPLSKSYQVIRGLISITQRFYRKHEKKEINYKQNKS